MKCSISLAVCLAALFFVVGALAQAPLAQVPDDPSDEATPEAASSPVAHVYVGSGNQVLAFSAAANGKLTPVSGSPFNFNLDLMGANGHYLFGFQSGSVVIQSLSMATNGALKMGATTNTETFNEAPDCPLVNWNGQGLRIDHSGENLYNAAIPGEFACDTWYQSFRIDDANGELTFLNNAGGVLLGGPSMNILGNNHFVYTPSCNAAFGNSPYPYVGVFERLSSGELATANAGVAIPPAPEDASYPGGPVPGYYCPLAMATDPTDHVAMTLNAFDNVDGGDGDGSFYGPVVIATFTADSKGNLKSTSTYKNMAKLPMGPYDACLACATLRMSPSGKLLAAGGSAGVVLFHFNGAGPATKYKTLLANNSIGTILWDNNNHMYALGTDSKGAGKLWVYTVTPTSTTEASGSPYSIASAGAMVVQNIK